MALLKNLINTKEQTSLNANQEKQVNYEQANH